MSGINASPQEDTFSQKSFTMRVHGLSFTSDPSDNTPLRSNSLVYRKKQTPVGSKELTDSNLVRLQNGVIVHE